MMLLQGVAQSLNNLLQSTLQPPLAAFCPFEGSVTCCRGDDSDAETSEDDDPKKPIPEWARGRALMQQLASQVQMDPDEVFQQHRKTCSLDEVFGHSGPHLHLHITCLSVRVDVFRSKDSE